MNQKQADRACSRPGNQGFSWRELLMLIVAVFVLLLLVLPRISRMSDKARRVNCLSNQSSLLKAASQWGLESPGAWRPSFPDTNLACALAMDDIGMMPVMFICPGAIGKNKSWGIRPVTKLADIREDNCNYAYFGGRRAEDSALILIADKNGSNDLPSADAWGGNHDGQGGNVVKVGGQGLWVSAPIDTNDSIVDAFSETGPVFEY